MSDQPVTPDREALIRITANTLAAADQRIVMRQPASAWAVEARQVVDALLPLLTEALDRARQQGEERGREKAAEAIEGAPTIVAVPFTAVCCRFEDEDAAECGNDPCPGHPDMSYRHLSREEFAALARGGPNRKDEE